MKTNNLNIKQNTLKKVISLTMVGVIGISLNACTKEEKNDHYITHFFSSDVELNGLFPYYTLKDVRVVYVNDQIYFLDFDYRNDEFCAVDFMTNRVIKSFTEEEAQAMNDYMTEHKIKGVGTFTYTCSKVFGEDIDDFELLLSYLEEDYGVQNSYSCFEIEATTNKIIKKNKPSKSLMKRD